MCEITSRPSVLVLDGGFSSQLSRHVGERVDGDPLWTARFLHTNPQAVIDTHLDFLRAGADAILTNTYQASIGGFVKHVGVTPEEGAALIRGAVELARRARDIYLKECQASGQTVFTPLIVGSVGPYGAHLHDGSEYNGAYADTTSADTMREWHLPRIKILLESGVDLLALETIPCSTEAEMLVQLIKEFPEAKAWISFSCKDDATLSHGENFKDTARKCIELNPKQIIAVGTNCCSPKIVANLFKDINQHNDNTIPLVTYPNSGEKYSVEVGWTDREHCEPLAMFVNDWLDIGVRYVGGCCRTYADDITEIKKVVNKWLKHNGKN